MTQLISIDIGSTYTKGALFELSGDELTITGLADTETTTDCLALGFNIVLKKLRAAKRHEGADEKTFFSSSAKGGLRVAAIGVVPTLTLSSAKQAAHSAGAKITSVYSYKLCGADIDEIKNNCPDIILFTGGTDGGNESYNLHNAKMLAAGKPGCPIIYAGNRSVADQVAEILSGCDLHVTENVLPKLDRINPDPAREKIRQIFLDTITKGKGLDKIIETTSSEPYPTPYAMFEYLKKIYESEMNFGPFCAVDIGGATTDVYSCCTDAHAPGIIVKGLPEPEVKRTVEGDLGLRVSAATAFESMSRFIENELKAGKYSTADFAAYIEKVDSRRTGDPEKNENAEFENVLAKACFFGALKRHAGTSEEAYTPQGKLLIQHGKDLRQAKKIIGAGGYLARAEHFTWNECFSTVPGESGHASLMPEDFTYYIDKTHIFPLLANISFAYPMAAVKKGIESLQIVEINN